MIRAELFVKGLVQGVFYRASAREEGERLGLSGEVRNLRDGRVHAVVEGPREVVEDFIAWCRKGPPSARVEDVQVEWTPATGNHRGFRVGR
ncbi:MAG TPA: acylphosphatase [Myxococcales bacterium]|jgi:acylphosphatase